MGEEAHIDQALPIPQQDPQAELLLSGEFELIHRAAERLPPAPLGGPAGPDPAFADC